MSNPAIEIVRLAKKVLKTYVDEASNALPAVGTPDQQNYLNKWTIIDQTKGYYREEGESPLLISQDFVAGQRYLQDWLDRLEDQFKPLPPLQALEGSENVWKANYKKLKDAVDKDKVAEKAAMDWKPVENVLLAKPIYHLRPDMEVGQYESDISQASVDIYMSLQEDYSWLLQTETVMTGVWAPMETGVPGEGPLALMKMVAKRLREMTENPKWIHWRDKTYPRMRGYREVILGKERDLDDMIRRLGDPEQCQNNCQWNQQGKIRSNGWDVPANHKERALHGEGLSSDFVSWCDHQCNTNFQESIGGANPGSPDVKMGFGNQLEWETNNVLNFDFTRDWYEGTWERYNHACAAGRAWAACRYLYPFWRDCQPFLKAMEDMEKLHQKLDSFVAMMRRLVFLVEFLVEGYSQEVLDTKVFAPFRLGLQDTAAAALPSSASLLLESLQDLFKARQEVLDFGRTHGTIAKWMASDKWQTFYVDYVAGGTTVVARWKALLQNPKYPSS